MRETIGAVVRKPVFRIKLIAISLLFVVSLIEQVSNNYIQSSGQQVGRMTVILLFMVTTLIISKKPGNTGISRDIRTEFTTDLLLSD